MSESSCASRLLLNHFVRWCRGHGWHALVYTCSKEVRIVVCMSSEALRKSFSRQLFFNGGSRPVIVASFMIADSLVVRVRDCIPFPVHCGAPL